MANSLKKRGQKIVRKFSRISVKAREEGKEHIKENLLARVSHIRDIKLLIAEWCLLVAGLVMLAVTQAFWSGSSYAQDVFVHGEEQVIRPSGGFECVLDASDSPTDLLHPMELLLYHTVIALIHLHSGEEIHAIGTDVIEYLL